MPIDIDVRETGSDVDPHSSSLNMGTLASIQQSLPGAVFADNVTQLMSRILVRLGSETIRRLRIFGHGAPGRQFIGGGLFPGYDQVIGVDAAGGLMSSAVLCQLGGRFARDGLVELHGCSTGAGAPGEALVAKLAIAWRVDVIASRRVQWGNTGGDGMIFQLQYPLVSALYSHEDGRFNYSTRESARVPPSTTIHVRWANQP